MGKKQEKTKKIKMPTAKKRDLQNEKKRIRNKSFKSKVKTFIKSFQTSLKEKNNKNSKEILNKVFSLLDKGVKKKILKKNKAGRIKSSLSKKRNFSASKEEEKNPL